MSKLIHARSPEIDKYIGLMFAAIEYADNAEDADEARRLIGELASVGLTDKNIVAVSRVLIKLSRKLRSILWPEDADG